MPDAATRWWPLESVDGRWVLCLLCLPARLFRAGMQRFARKMKSPGGYRRPEQPNFSRRITEGVRLPLSMKMSFPSAISEPNFRVSMGRP